MYHIQIFLPALRGVYFDSVQVQTYRFQGHSPADPEHERGRKEEKRWARATQDPITIFEEEALEDGVFTKVRARWTKTLPPRP